MESLLRAITGKFDLNTALWITDFMHNEDATRDLSNEEERLWEKLTWMIEEEKENHLFVK